MHFVYADRSLRRRAFVVKFMATTNTKNMNKDLVLREYLAIERTKLANERTLLTYIRTGLYFLVAGSTLGELIDTVFWNTMGTPLIIVGAIVTALGVVRFIRVGREIRNTRKHVGNASLEFIKSIKGVE
jgi:putative membrane protein